MVPIRTQRTPPRKVVHVIPPHMGFGSEDDSLLSVYYLDPKNKTRENIIKKFKSDKHIIRFRAKMISSTPSDEERNFIISYFARDDSIQIYETADKNSGRVSSKFMERKKMKNPFTGRFYAQRDFGVGNSIYVNKHIFKLIECDDYTTKYIRDNPEFFKDSELVTIIDKIRLAGLRYANFEEYAVEILKKLDPDCKHFVSGEYIGKVLNE